MSKYLSCLVGMAFLLGGCSAKEPSLSEQYPKKPADTTERKAGRAMLFYEQAEKDLDIHNSVIVIEPAEKETPPPDKKQ